MVKSIAFKTRARTIDHLGREQIADCPTAISELWKNSYDAYAREVSLHIFDGDVPVAAVFDNGHGMSHEEFIEKWLVVGTESKASAMEVPEDDRNDLPYREKQGQKGIGRLSSAYLGSLLLLISKRKTNSFVATLIDWRLFENPFLYLQDVEIPVVEFDNKVDFWMQIASLFDRMMGNVWGDGNDSARDERVVAAWATYNALEREEGRTSTKAAIEETLIGTTFTERHIENWPVWANTSPHGTAMLMANITYDLEAQLYSAGTTSESDALQSAKDKLFQTLSNFTDPFVDPHEVESGLGADDFKYSVTAWEGALSRPIISDEREFDYGNLEELEHVLDGEIDVSGIFRGKVRAFGKWLGGEVIINPISAVPTRSDSRVGSFHLRIGTFEQTREKTTHPAELHSKLMEQAGKYGGFMVYRNGLRVMPYGREDNDFFEIELRRTKHFGREFWSYRRLFGRVALTRLENPNLRDKAGREGIIDNKAAKTFRDIVINILMESARRFYGTDSDIRAQALPDIKENYAKQKAEEAQKRIKARKRREFRSRLMTNLPQMRLLEEELIKLAVTARSDSLPTTETELLTVRERLSELKEQRIRLALGPAPNVLGALESDYRAFRSCDNSAAELIVRLGASISHHLERIKPKSSKEVAYSEISRNAAYLQHRLRKWSAETKEILSGEIKRISDLTDERNKRYHSETLPLLDDLEHGRTTLAGVLDQLELERDRQDRENSELFEPYISTLKSLQDSIDIETMVSFTMEEAADLRQELDRLNALAQLGITVEIIGHEIEGLEMTISQGLEHLPNVAKDTPLFATIRAAHGALVDRLRFLSPLKLSGEKVRTWIGGENIVDYVKGFMGESLGRRGITLNVSPEFARFSVYEQASRIFPVFINLINNAAYWVSQSPTNSKTIFLDIVDGKVVVADDGPGVEKDDVKSLFTLFFTRKIRGGRGVGLYLCRANLAAGGHTISYATENRLRRLSGANFIIDFKGAKYD
ncbi:MAG: histidine kinase [Syntrophus sp. (in: bacteria)]|nr:histidine kinase [Syntrophus sp. (in: bacteria)]